MSTTDQSQEFLDALAAEVRRISGMDVTCTRDCEVMSEELRAFDGRFPVSVSTLRRFFGLIPKQGRYSTNTLNSLSRYAGHASFREWRRHHKSEVAAQPSQGNAGGVSPSPKRHRQEPASRAWSNREVHAQLERFVQRFRDPKDFHLTTREFRRLKEAVFTVYQRGILDMKWWGQLSEHPHLIRFVIEQFPPLDFLATFGGTMLASFAQHASTPGDLQFVNSLKAAGLVAQDAPWIECIDALPRLQQLNPSIHPLVQSRQLGIAMLAESEGHPRPDGERSAVDLALEGLHNEQALWPRWANQSCYFAFNLADWAILSREMDVVQAISENIHSFQISQDWYNRDSDMDTILNLRQVWNFIELDQKEDASDVLRRLDWLSFESMETRTLSLWYHSAMWILNHASPDVCQANIEQAAAVTQYHGLKRRIHELVTNHVS